MKRKSTAYDQVMDIYRKYGGEGYMIGEGITQSNHVLQAAYIAFICGAPENVVVGLLLHDVGQFIDNDTGSPNDRNHAEVGAKWLESQGFRPSCTKIVGHHALAKIALCATDEQYHGRLTRASQISYIVQKEKYETNGQLREFLSSESKDQYMAARRCDDMGKIVGFESPDNGFGAGAGKFSLPGFIAYEQMVNIVQKGNGRQARDPAWIENIETLYEYMSINQKEFEREISTNPKPNFHEIKAKIILQKHPSDHKGGRRHFPSLNNVQSQQVFKEREKKHFEHG